jgi:hypothetical protein
LKGKVTSLLLFLCLVAPLAVTFTFLHYQKVQIRRKVAREIISSEDHDGLVLLKFTEKEAQTLLRWEHSREFEFADQMYDIVKTEARGDTTYYWCWLDEAETKLNQQLNKLLVGAQDQGPINTTDQEKLANFFKSLYFAISDTWSVSTFQSALIPPPYGHHYSSMTHPPPVPPPKAKG